MVMNLVGCISPCRTVAVDVRATNWEQATELQLANTDTTHLYDIKIFARYNDRFLGDTITIAVASLTPDALRCVEYLLLHLPKQTSVAALQNEYDTPYRKAVRLNQQGTYRFQFTPTRPVQGIESIGIDLKPTS